MARDTYTKAREDWKNDPSKDTPIMAEDMEHIEAGIKTAMDNRALKEVYGDASIDMGRQSGTVSGRCSVTAGSGVEASGDLSQSFGMGSKATAFCASARGNSEATESYADSSGSGTKASGTAARTSGIGTRATADAADAGGIQTEATASGACSRGYKTKSNAPFSTTEGFCTEAGSVHQHVQGRYNVVDNNGLYADIVGGGSSEDNRKNIYALDWQGNGHFAGDVTTESGASLNSIGLPEDVDIDFSNYFT